MDGNACRRRTDFVCTRASSHDPPPRPQDRLPWLHKIRHTARLLTSPAASKILLSTASKQSDLPDELSVALSKIHPASESAATHRPAGKRRALVVACSALKLSYRDLLRGVGEPPEDAEADPLETYFIYRQSPGSSRVGSFPADAHPVLPPSSTFIQTGKQSTEPARFSSTE